MAGPAVQDLEASVARAIRKFVPELVGELPPEAFLDEVGVDSMSLVDVVLELQDEFLVELPDDALAGIATVRDLVATLQGLIDAQSRAVSEPRG